MVDLKVLDGKLELHVKGMDELWALKSTLEIPLLHVERAYVDEEIARRWWHGLRMPGTNLPGVITAGTFYQDGKRVFWDVHHPEKTIVIELRDEKYQQLVVEVADSSGAVQLVNSALQGRS